MARFVPTLGITTSAGVGVAVVTAERDVALTGGGQALEALLPTVMRALGEVGLRVDDLDRMAVDVGPGSFTGLRIGVSFAKTLAQAQGLELVGVSAYDIAEVDAGEAYPRIAVVAGKENYYYVRICTAPDAAAEFVHGDGETVRRRLAAIVDPLPDLGKLAFIKGPAERARAVALMGERLQKRGASTDWRQVNIDYGQRPNAVINWEARRVKGPQRRDKGQHRQAAKQKNR